MSEVKPYEIEYIYLDQCDTPVDYHCTCEFCQKFLGVLQREDGSYYNKNERRKYYSPMESSHIAKTPLHLARYLIQEYSSPGDWVIDPTMGAGTTAVEALRQGRSVAGVELEFYDVVQANIDANNTHGIDYHFRRGDARNIGEFLEPLPEASLVVNNPPYSGDENQRGMGKDATMNQYNKNLPNLAFMKENQAYWDQMSAIYRACVDKLRVGGHIAIGVKDMMRAKKPFLLHKGYCDELVKFPDLEYVGMVLLPHYPATLFMRTYPKRYGILVPAYQTINIFKKVR